MKDFIFKNKTFKIVFFGLLFISLVFMITMTSIAQSGEKVLRIPISYGLDNLDPRTRVAQNYAVVQTAIFEPLVRIHNGNVLPGMAKTWEISDDGTIYTFHLRDARWSDGKEVTAGDFVRAFVRLFQVHQASQNLDDIKNGAQLRAGKVPPEQLGVQAPDDKTLVITTKNPVPYFMGLMYYYGYPGRQDLRKKFGDGYGVTVESLAYCGPFILKEFKHESRMVLEKNPDYWNADKIKLDKVVIYVLPDPQTRRNMFDRGEIDYFIPTTENEALEYESKGMLMRYGGGTVYYIALNRHGQNDPVKAKILGNPNFMKAVSYAIDRRGYIDNVLQGNGVPATVQVPPGIGIYPGKTWGDVSKNYGKYHAETADLAKSKAYMDKVLEDMGYSTVGQFPKFDFLTRESAQDPRSMSAYLLSVFSDIGLKIDYLQTTQKQYYMNLYKPALAYDFAMSSWSGAYDDPNTFMWYWNSKSLDMGVTFENPEYDAFMVAANKEIDLVKRAQILNQAEALFADIAPCIPFIYNKGEVVVQKWVKGLTTASSGLNIDYIYSNIVK